MKYLLAFSQKTKENHFHTFSHCFLERTIFWNKTGSCQEHLGFTLFQNKMVIRRSPINKIMNNGWRNAYLKSGCLRVTMNVDCSRICCTCTPSFYTHIISQFPTQLTFPRLNTVKIWRNFNRRKILTDENIYLTRCFNRRKISTHEKFDLTRTFNRRIILSDINV